MKTILLASLLFLKLIALPVNAQVGGTFALTWSTIDGGGGSSTDGAFTLRGTIGQPDAGAATGGDFALSGGFWPGIGSTEPIPRLRIKLAGPDVILSWPDPSTGYQLQESGGLNGAGTSWVPVSQSPTTTGSEKQVRLPVTGTARMFRLCKAAP